MGNLPGHQFTKKVCRKTYRELCRVHDEQKTITKAKADAEL